MSLLRQALTPENAAQSVAQEGFVNNTMVRLHHFFERSEREIGQEHVNAAAIEHRIVKLLELAETKKELVDDPLAIPLAAWAKWLVVDGKVIDDPDLLIKELGRLRDLVGLFAKDWMACYVRAVQETASKILTPALASPAKGLESVKAVLSSFYPLSFDRLMTKNIAVIDGDSHVKKRGSDPYIGIGSVLRQPWPWHKEDELPRIMLTLEGYERKDPKAAEIVPFAPGQVKRVLAVVREVMAAGDAGDAKAAHSAQDILYAALDKFEAKYGQWKSESGNATQKDINEVRSVALTIFYEWTMAMDLLQQADHICQVAVKLCDGSLRRSE